MQDITCEPKQQAVYFQQPIAVEEEKEQEVVENLVVDEIIEEEKQGFENQPQIELGEQVDEIVDEQAMQQQEENEFSEDSYDEADLEEATANEAIITSIEEANR